MGMIFEALFGSMNKPDIGKVGNGVKNLGGSLVNHLANELKTGKDAYDRGVCMSNEEIKKAYKSSTSSTVKTGYAQAYKKNNK